MEGFFSLKDKLAQALAETEESGGNFRVSDHDKLFAYLWRIADRITSPGGKNPKGTIDHVWVMVCREQPPDFYFEARMITSQKPTYNEDSILEIDAGGTNIDEKNWIENPGYVLNMPEFFPVTIFKCQRRFHDLPSLWKSRLEKELKEKIKQRSDRTRKLPERLKTSIQSRKNK
jgi:hypothetical protein